MSCPARLYPLRQPKNHRLPIPRWKLKFPSGISHVYTAYIGIQQHADHQAALEAKDDAISAVQAWLKAEEPSAFERFNVIDGSDIHNAAVWVCYWTDPAKFKQSLDSLSLPSLYNRLPASGSTSVGIWRESFASEISRLETNYSGLDYLPGLARIPDTTTDEHSFSAYWGAARDRIPDSAHDLFPKSPNAGVASIPRGIGQYLVGVNYDNLVHIRSGQFWDNCSQDEADAYERKLEPTLQSGLEYLWSNPRETGAYGLRYLGNEGTRKETCGAGFFTSLETLEEWAKTHRSHLAIYRGALLHYKAFGDRRKLRTWHEVSVLRDGDAKFEYVNCVPSTGVIQGVPLEVVNDCLPSV
ncbi:hypothetical protein BHE90_013087 [Fusarium euwallaceae]|uniref:Phenylacetaldoxime dehydratase n=4 Tax=Fusarium solani species complex TaxID=232080 RepID=A0A3M2RDZ4_9HYPO|nr:hypothetical protein CDV36_014930 [Fusarium kuroshium]RSL61679.1 hypothetical protein CEP51_013594 [Fusarium floridanum]RSL92237.1 hypothetical protein CDV31_015245 [Fusarium ambrosium]RTE72489.1 hypothetical protein BHE90_013087 [Fusarium euwallaceae]